MMKNTQLTQDYLKQVLSYDQDTGMFRHLRTSGNGRLNAPAGFYHNGYVLIGIDRIEYRAHRLAWLYVYGDWPLIQIDHINGIKDDNRMSNLRLATRSQNSRNSKVSKNNKCGLKGVCFEKYTGRWKAQIYFDGQNRNLGRFNTKESAHAAYIMAALKHHGEFARF